MRGSGGAFALRFGANLAYCRNRAGDISQEELGMRAGLHRTAVGQLERGERVARTDTLVKLAGSLQIPYAELLNGLLWTPSIRTEGVMAIESLADEAFLIAPQAAADSKRVDREPIAR